MIEVFVENGFPFGNKAPWLTDEEYSNAISTLVFVCTDTVVVCEGAVFLAKRRSEPMSDWWVIGGRMKFGELPEQSAARCFTRETKLEVPTHRFKQFGTYMTLWKTRAQEPRDAGSQSLNITYALNLSKEELQRICLDEKEYSRETLLLYPNQINDMVKEGKITRYFGAVMADLKNQNIV